MEITTEGVVSDLDRTTHVSGGETASTTHISLFSLGEERVLLRTASPAMIKDGDSVRVAGRKLNGQFSASACKNLSTGWVSGYRTQGCAKAMLVAFMLITLLFTYIFPLFLVMTLFSGVALFLVVRSSRRNRRLHEMVENP